MKFALSQLRKVLKQYPFEYEYDLKNNIKNRDDLLDVINCHVDGKVLNVSDDYVDIHLSIDATLKMQCAISLDEVIYPLTIDTDVIFSYDVDSDNYLINGQTIDIDDAVLSEIVINLPYRVVKEEYEDDYLEDEEL